MTGYHFFHSIELPWVMITEEKHTTPAFRFSITRDDTSIAHAWLYLVHNDLHSEPFGLLEDLWVDEAHRGQGIASELLGHVVEKAKSAQCYKLIANSRSERTHVHQLYEKIGFKKWGHEFRLELK